MKNIAIEILTQTASFRYPDFQNFHKSLDLPPPTTVIGLTGAALGLSPLQSQEFFDTSDLKFGVVGTHAGKCSDTWKYNKGERSMRMYKPGIDGSIIQKEFLIKSRFIICFSGKPEFIEKIFNAFNNPKYALTMGNSDSLAFIKDVKLDLDEISSNEVKNCMLSGNVIDDVLSLSAQSMEFSIYQTTEPLTYDLPLRFKYSNDYGKRTISTIGTYSIIGNIMKLNYQVQGLLYKNEFVPLIKYNGWA